MKRKIRCIYVLFKGDAYATQFWEEKTLSECLSSIGLKRSNVSSWWVEYERV
jgi:hypothetical protein